jgi:hypothetical protein
MVLPAVRLMRRRAICHTFVVCVFSVCVAFYLFLIFNRTLVEECDLGCNTFPNNDHYYLTAESLVQIELFRIKIHF